MLLRVAGKTVRTMALLSQSLCSSGDQLQHTHTHTHTHTRPPDWSRWLPVLPRKPGARVRALQSVRIRVWEVAFGAANASH